MSCKNCFENPRNAYCKTPLPCSVENPLNVAIVQKIRQNSFGAVSPHSSPSCLPGKTFCLHFCDTVAGFCYIYSRLLLLTFICLCCLLLVPPKLYVSLSFYVLQ